MPINSKNILIFDTECLGLDYRRHDVVQLAAIVVDPRSLDVIPGAVFSSKIKPERPENASEEALRITGFNLEDLKNAPSEKVVWKDFVNFVNSFNKGKTKFTAPIPCGYNIFNFDNKFINELCKKYGQWDHERDEQTLFGFPGLDVYHMMWTWFESNGDIKSLSLDSFREYFGIIETGHDALVDCYTTHRILQRFMWFQRKMASKTKFKGSFSANVVEESKA